jgi:hypothetical protein
MIIMFRNIRRVGQLLSFEHKFWNDPKLVYVPVSQVLLTVESNRRLIVKVQDRTWSAHYEQEQHCNDILHKFIATINGTKSDLGYLQPSPDPLAIYELQRL